MEDFVGRQGTMPHVLLSQGHTPEVSKAENEMSNAPHLLLSTGHMFSGPRVPK